VELAKLNNSFNLSEVPTMKIVWLTILLSAVFCIAAAAGLYLLLQSSQSPASVASMLTPTVQTKKSTPDPVAADPEKPSTEAEPLPDLPKADPKSTFKQLLPTEKLYLESLPNGTKRVLFDAEVCLREGVLEVLLCKKNTKEHEAILRTAIDARFLHAALIAIGSKPGKPVQFVNAATGEADYKPATGGELKVSLHYRKDGKLHTHLAQEWIRDQQTKKPMAYNWVFAGSRFMKNPDRPNDPDYYTANNGEIISISNFVDSMLEIPIEVSRENASLNYLAETGKIPPQLSKVWVILEPVVDKK
jgi:hypothetical protein